MFFIHQVRWDQMGTADIGEVRDVVRRTLSAAAVKSRRPEERFQAIERALAAEFGDWISGWGYSIGDGGLGTVVSRYDRRLFSSTENAIDSVGRAVAEWIGRIADLRRLFDEVKEATAGFDDAKTASYAVTALVPPILEWTQVEDAWYASFALVLGWCLTHCLGDPDRAERVASEVSTGHFQSWIAPSPEVMKQACETAEREMSRAIPRQLPDSLATWRNARTDRHWWRARFYSPEPVTTDGHELYIERVDRPRDAERADRLVAALHFVRGLARVGRPLDFDLLCEAQQMVLSEPASFRATDAYAHDGTERYGISSETFDQFRAAVAQAADDSIPPTARAARLYCDVCFYHPFADGNARAARIALDYVLTRAGLALHSAEPLFRYPIRATNPRTGGSFSYYVDFLAAPRAV